MRQFIGAAFLSLLVLVGISSASQSMPTPQVRLLSTVQSHRRFAALTHSVLHWVAAHPQSPASPRLLLRLVMASVLRGSTSAELKTAIVHLLIHYPTSFQSHEFLLAVQLHSVNKKRSTACATILSDLLNYYVRHQNPRTAAAIDRIIRFGLSHFGFTYLDTGTSEPFLAYFAARQAGDRVVAAEMRAATRPVADAREKLQSLQDAQLRRIVLDTRLDPVEKISHIMAIGMTTPPVHLIQYFLHRLTPAQTASPGGKRIKVQVLVADYHWRKARRLLARYIQHRRSAYREYLLTYTLVELGRIKEAQSAESALKEYFPRSRWLKDARLLIRLAPRQQTDAAGLTAEVLGLIGGLRHVGQITLTARLGRSSTSLQFDALVKKHQALVQVTEGKKLLIAARANHQAARLYLPRQRLILASSTSTAAQLLAQRLGQPDYMKSLQRLDTPSGRNGGSFGSVLADTLRGYWIGTKLLHSFQKMGIFIDARNGSDGKVKISIIRTNIWQPRFQALHLKFTGTKMLSAYSGKLFSLHFDAHRASVSSIHFAPWRPAKVVLFNKASPDIFRYFGYALGDAMDVMSIGYGDLEREIQHSSGKTQGGHQEIAAEVLHRPLPPPYAGRPRWPAIQLAPEQSGSRTGAGLESARRIYDEMCSEVFVGHLRRAGAAERRLILFHAAGLCGRFDLRRFSTVKRFSLLIEAILKHHAADMDKRVAVPTLRLVEYGMQKFHSSKNFLNLFGSHGRTDIIMLHTMALEYGFPKLASIFQEIAGALARSDKPLVKVASLLASKKLSMERRFSRLSRMTYAGPMLPYVCLFAASTYKNIKPTPRYLREMELLDAEAHDDRGALALGDELLIHRQATAHSDYILALSDLRMGQFKPACGVVAEALKNFKNTPWADDLNVIRRSAGGGGFVSASAVSTLLKLDDWIIHNQKAVGITFSDRTPEGVLVQGSAILSHRLIKIYVAINQHPVSAFRLGRSSITLLSDTEKAYERFRTPGIHLCDELLISRSVEGRNAVHFGLRFSSSPATVYGEPPLAETWLQPCFHTRRGLQIMLSRMQDAASVVPRHSRSPQKSVILRIDRLGHTSPSGLPLLLCVADSGRPLWIKSGGIAIRFTVAAEPSGLTIPGWMHLPTITEPRTNSIAILGKFTRSVFGGFGQIYFAIEPKKPAP